jgi:hypothetical protein
MVLCDSPGIPTCDVEVGASRCLLLRKVFRVECAILSQLESSKDIWYESSAFTGLGTAKVIQQSVVQLRAWILTLQVPGTRTPPDNEDAQCPLSRGRL